MSSGTFLDQKNARLCFDLKNTTADPVHLDGGAQCLIQRLRVFSVQGVELERIESYGLLHTTLEQYTAGDTHMKASNILSGAPSRCQETPYFNEVTGTTAVAPPLGLQLCLAEESRSASLLPRQAPKMPPRLS